METESPRAREIQAAISHILFHDWDPIGVSEIASVDAADEYDSYVVVVYQLIADGAEATVIAAHLVRVAREWMGLYSTVEQVMLVARKLTQLQNQIE